MPGKQKRRHTVTARCTSLFFFAIWVWFKIETKNLHTTTFWHKFFTYTHRRFILVRDCTEIKFYRMTHTHTFPFMYLYISLLCTGLTHNVETVVHWFPMVFMDVVFLDWKTGHVMLNMVVYRLSGNIAHTHTWQKTFHQFSSASIENTLKRYRKIIYKKKYVQKKQFSLLYKRLAI